MDCFTFIKNKIYAKRDYKNIFLGVDEPPNIKGESEADYICRKAYVEALEEISQEARIRLGMPKKEDKKQIKKE
mgnify:CR=1 FL=1